MADSKNSPRKIAAAERRTEFLELRKAGHSFAIIGSKMGVSEQRAHQVVTEELSRQIGKACAQLRTVALSASAPEKLARLLLELGQSGGQSTEIGTRFRFSLTHEEIGEFIGASRETVTRTMSVFTHRRLVARHGATLTIPSRLALESYARC